MTDTYTLPYTESEASDLLQISSEHKLRSENLAFDFDVWYPPLARFTFPSECIPLSRPEARALLHYQETRYLGRGELSEADVRALQQLEARLHDRINAPGVYPEGAFLRLCGRSPKDGEPLARGRVREQYARELAKLREQGEDINAANVRYQAVARVPCLRVTTGQEAMSLLLTSERVFADIHDWLKFGEPEQVVLRQWEPALTLEFEFRAFIYRAAHCDFTVRSLWRLPTAAGVVATD